MTNRTVSTAKARAGQWAEHLPPVGARVAVYDEVPGYALRLRGTGTVIAVDTTDIGDPIAVQIDGEPPIDASLLKHWVSNFRVLPSDAESAPETGSPEPEAGSTAVTTRLSAALEAVATLIGRKGAVSRVTRIYDAPDGERDALTVYGGLGAGAASAAWSQKPCGGWPRYTWTVGNLDVVFVDEESMGGLSAHHLRKLAALNPSQISCDPLGERLVLLDGVTVEQLNLVREEFGIVRLGRFGVDDQKPDSGDLGYDGGPWED